MPFLENVTRGRGIPRERLRGGRRALPPLRRRQPDQRPEQGADRRAREGARRGRHRPAGLLGQPQLGALRRGRLAADGRRRHRARLRASRPRPTPRSPAAGSTTRTSPGPASRWIDPRRAARPRRSCRTTSTRPGFVQANADALAAALAVAARGRPRHRPAGRDRAQHPGRDGRRRRPAGRRLRGRADGARRSWSSTPRRPGAAVRPGVAEPQRAAVRAVAGARRQRPPAGAGRGGGDRRSSSSRSGFVSDHLEVIWDLDNEARGDRRRARPGLRPGGDGRHAPGLRRVAARAAGGAAGRRRAAAGHQLPRACCFVALVAWRHRDQGRPRPSGAAGRATRGGAAAPTRGGAATRTRWSAGGRRGT